MQGNLELYTCIYHIARQAQLTDLNKILSNDSLIISILNVELEFNCNRQLINIRNNIHDIFHVSWETLVMFMYDIHVKWHNTISMQDAGERFVQLLEMSYS